MGFLFKKKEKSCGGKKEEEGPSTVLRLDLHCEGCASKFKGKVRRLEGVEKVLVDLEANVLCVIGNVDPAWLRDTVELKTKRKVELLSPLPKQKTKGAADEKAAAKEKKDGGVAAKEKTKAAEKGGGSGEEKVAAKEKTKAAAEKGRGSGDEKVAAKEKTKAAEKPADEGTTTTTRMYNNNQRYGNANQDYCGGGYDNNYHVANQTGVPHYGPPPPPPPSYWDHQTFSDENPLGCSIM